MTWAISDVERAAYHFRTMIRSLAGKKRDHIINGKPIAFNNMTYGCLNTLCDAILIETDEAGEHEATADREDEDSSEDVVEIPVVKEEVPVVELSDDEPSSKTVPEELDLDDLESKLFTPAMDATPKMSASIGVKKPYVLGGASKLLEMSAIAALADGSSSVG
eukprot:7465468-Pyramimonas_sp.AAC.1